MEEKQDETRRLQENPDWIKNGPISDAIPETNGLHRLGMQRGTGTGLSPLIMDNPVAGHLHQSAKPGRLLFGVHQRSLDRRML